MRSFSDDVFGNRHISRSRGIDVLSAYSILALLYGKNDESGIRHGSNQT